MQSHLDTFLLVFLRVGGLFLAAPLFGSQLFPVQVRVWLAFVLAVMLFGVAPKVELTGGVSMYAVACASETALGLVIGFVGHALLHALGIAGHAIDTELGITMGQALDPVTQESSSVVTQLLMLGGTVLFLALDGHHVILSSLKFSLTRVPLGGFVLNDEITTWILLQLVPQIFVIGVTFAAPVVCAVLLSTLALGLVARVAPEMNVFSFAFPLRVLVGFVLLGVSVRYMAPVAEMIVDRTYGNLAAMLLRA